MDCAIIRDKAQSLQYLAMAIMARASVSNLFSEDPASIITPNIRESLLSIMGKEGFNVLN